MKTDLAVAKINFKNSKLSYMIFLIAVGAVLISTITNMIFTPNEAGQNYQVGVGSYAYLLVLLMAIFIPALNFRKFMNLNVKKGAYIRGCAVNYVVVALLASAFNHLCLLAVDPLLTLPPRFFVWNLVNIFGWSANGLVVAFFQQFAFLLLLAAVAHTLTTIQTFWFGIAVDLVIVAIISVFTPIEPLRNVLVGFFGLILFHPNPWLQIGTCLLLAVVVYVLSIPAVKRKPV